MAKTVSQKPTLLSGGNPQIAKGDGDASVQAYIAAMPGWKSDAGRRLDALITRTVPDALKAVRWNSPFYGVEGQGRSEEHTSELQVTNAHLVCRLLLDKKTITSTHNEIS